MKKISKIIILVVILAGIVAGCLFYFIMPDNVDIERPEKRKLSLDISEIGVVEADDQVTYYAPVSGTIQKVNCSKNDIISKNTVLADYDISQLEQEYKIASINSDYQENGFNAANTENEKNKSNASKYAESDSNYKSQYVDASNQSNSISNAVNDREHTNSSTRSTLENNISQTQSDLELAKSEYETKQSVVTELETQIVSVKAELSAADKLIEESKERLTSYKEKRSEQEPGSDKYNSLSEKIEAENSTLTEAKTAKTSLKSKKETLESELETAKSERDTAEKEVNSLLETLSSYQNELSSLPTDGMTNDESEKYSELSTKLEVINKEWAEAVEKKNTAESNIINQDQLDQYEDAYHLAQAEEDQKLTFLEKGKKGVVAAADGIIVERLVDDGASVEAGTPLFIVQPESGYKVKVMISRYDMDSIAVGNIASIKIGDSTYSGKVSFVAPIAEEDSTGKPRARVEITFDEDVKPVIGIEAEVTIIADEKESVLSVKNASVYTDDEGDYVYIISGGKVEKRYINKGITGSGFTEVIEGLSESDQVITSAVSDENIGDSVSAD